MDRLLKTQEEFAFAATAAMAGQTVRVLVEAAGRNEGTVNGRSIITLLWSSQPPRRSSASGMVRITAPAPPCWSASLPSKPVSNLLYIIKENIYHGLH